MPNYRTPEAAAYRKWYKLARWQALRSARLAAEPLCRMCRAFGRVTAAGVVDHIKPHRGDARLFFDPGNLQSLCKPCHDRHKQAMERGHATPGANADGSPVDPLHPWYR